MDYRIGLWLLALLNLLDFGQAKRPFVLELYKFDCSILDPSFSSDFRCILDRKGSVPIVSVFFMLSQPIPQFTMLYRLDLIKKDQKKMNIAEVMIDGCKFLGSFYNNFMYGKLFKRIQSLSNLPRKCPLPPNKLYAIRNYTVVPDEYPLGSPAVKYTMGLTFYRANRTVARAVTDGAVVYKDRK